MGCYWYLASKQKAIFLLKEIRRSSCISWICKSEKWHSRLCKPLWFWSLLSSRALCRTTASLNSLEKKFLSLFNNLFAVQRGITDIGRLVIKMKNAIFIWFCKINSRITKIPPRSTAFFLKQSLELAPALHSKDTGMLSSFLLRPVINMYLIYFMHLTLYVELSLCNSSYSWISCDQSFLIPSPCSDH